MTVLVGLPVLIALLSVVVRPLQARQAERREAEGQLTALGADTAAGLRVLRGIGGEPQFLRRYNARSEQVRLAGVRVAGLQATLDAAHVALPGAFVVLLTWLGARAAITGRITPGEMVTLYGYAAFLVAPLTTATEALGKAVRARVGAGRLVAPFGCARRTWGPLRGGPPPGTFPRSDGTCPRPGHRCSTRRPG